MSHKESPITPSVGRIVLVRGLHVDNQNPTRTLPAIVTRVRSQNCIDLQLFGTDHVDPKMCSVVYDSNFDIVPLWAAWCWMDYQVKADAEKKASELPVVSSAESPIEVDWSKAEPDGYNPGFEGGFGWALAKMKDGLSLQRRGWNGKDMFVYHVPGGEYPAQTTAAKLVFGKLVPYDAYLALRTAQGSVIPWLASQTDLLAEDWEVVLSDAA